MKLNLARLEKVKHLGDGEVVARCPACAEGGQDRKGEHLIIYPDGRFGCCVHSNNKEHRKRIFALVGDSSSQNFRIDVKVPNYGQKTQGVPVDIARLGHLFTTPEQKNYKIIAIPDSSDGVNKLFTYREDNHVHIRGLPETQFTERNVSKR